MHVNTIAPLAASKMTETVLPQEMLALLKPSFILPLVGFLSHEECGESGSIFEAGAVYYGKLRRERSKGVVFQTTPSFLPSSIAAKWDQIGDFSTGTTAPTSIMETDWLSLLQASKEPHPPNKIHFQNQVVLITGAGGGLGKAYAHMFAACGARVVVNDVNKQNADAVVAEIKEKKGVAVADYHSVLDAAAVVKTALDAFGRIDVLVNNAGILRDKSFVKMSMDEVGYFSFV